MSIQAYNGKEPYIFISYAHKDAAIVMPIIESLQNAGFRIWYDAGIEVGTEWPETIAEHLEAATRVITFISPAFIDSQNCRRELNFSIDLKKEPIAVYLETFTLSPGMRMQLGTLQALFRSGHATFESFMDALIRVRELAICRDVIDVSDTKAVEDTLAKLVSESAFSVARGYAKRVLEIDSSIAEAYRYLLLAELELSDEAKLSLLSTPLDGYSSYQSYLRYADPISAGRFEAYNREIKARLEREEERDRRVKKREMLEKAQGQSHDLLVSQYTERKALEKKIADKERALSVSSHPDEVKKYSVPVVVTAGVNIFSLIVLFALDGEGPFFALLMVWLATLIVYPIMAFRHCFKLKVSRALFLLNFVTSFTFSIFWAVSHLTKLPKLRVAFKELDDLKAELDKLQAEIKLSESRLSELNASLDANLT